MAALGRSSHQAFAFLLVPDPDWVTEPAKRRLDVIENLTELGTGFALANHDLEIRGAGGTAWRGPEWCHRGDRVFRCTQNI